MQRKLFWLTVVTTLFISGCGKSLDKDIVGKWSYEMSIPMDDNEAAGQLSLKCTDDYFPNKSVTHDCDMKVSATAKNGGSKFELEGKLKATGDWSVTDKTVYDKTIDGKLELVKFSVDGETISDKAKLEEISKSMENPFVKGETSAYVTTSFDGKTWVYETEADKKKISVSATKQ